MQRALCALPALHLADTPEGMDVTNVSKRAFPIVSSMVPASELALPHAEHPPRTEHAMHQASRHPLLWPCIPVAASYRTLCYGRVCSTVL